jgi:hypothetical protein
LARPTLYSTELAEQFCGRFAEGEEPADICKTEGFPSIWTITRWRRKHPEFADLYADAQIAYEELTFAEMKAIVDDRSKDFKDTKTGRHIAVDYEAVGRSKLRYEERRNRLAKLNPVRFSDRQQIDSTVDQTVKVEREPVSDLETAKRLAFILQRAGMDILPPGMKAVPIDAVVLTERQDESAAANRPAEAPAWVASATRTEAGEAGEHAVSRSRTRSRAKHSAIVPASRERSA